MCGGLMLSLTAFAAIAVGTEETTPAAWAAPVSLARVASTVPAATIGAFEKEVLRLTNKARAKKRKCGSTTFKALKALKWNAVLAAVAENHSRDMSVRNYFAHTNPDGLSPFNRMKKAGYRYRAAGENIAAGYATPASVVAAWLKSPGHCRNIMNKSFTRLGVGYYQGSGTYRHYITQTFAKPA